MNDKPINPRDSYDFLIATACARNATSISLRHSARALRIVGDYVAADDYDKLAANYDRIAERYRMEAMSAPDSPQRPGAGIRISLEDLAGFPLKKLETPGNLS